MPQLTSPFIEGKYGWNFGESNWNGGMDENLLKFSYLFDKNIEGIVTSLPPPVNGNAYFLTTDKRVWYVVAGVYYNTPIPKWFTLVEKSTGNTYQFDGSNLTQVSSVADLDSRVDALEITAQELGTAAFEDASVFVSSAALSANTGSSSVGFTSESLPSQNKVSGKLSSLEKNIWDFQNLVTTKTDLLNPTTWDWTPAIQGAIDYLNTAGGGTLTFPRGVFKHSGSIQLKKFVSVRGEGTGYDSSTGTVLWYLGVGDGWYTLNTINTSSPMHCHIHKVTFYGPAVGLGKGVFADTCGTELHFDTVSFIFPATASGLILDQTEISDFVRCQWLAIGVDPAKNGACVWIVNGDSRTPGAGPFFTNQIKFQFCNFNPHGSGAHCVKDEGGLDHEFLSCNWNGGYIQYDGSGVNGLRIIGGEMEAAELGHINITRGPNNYPSLGIEISGVYHYLTAGATGINVPSGVTDHITHNSNVYAGGVGSTSTNIHGTTITSYGNLARDGASEPYNNYSVPLTKSSSNVTVSGATTPGSNTYSSRSGIWARNGRAVSYNVSIVMSKDAAMAGDVIVTGVPFISEASTIFPITLYSGITLPSGYTSLSGVLQTNSQTIRLFRSGSGVNFSPVQASELATGTDAVEFYMSGTFMTSEGQ